MGRPARRAFEIEAAREQILDAAARVFAESGYRGATMARIAEEAGYTAPTLYSYFDGKQAIFEALVEQVRSEAIATFDLPMPSGLTLRQRLELLLGHQFAWADRRSDVFTFFMNAQALRGAVPGLRVAPLGRASRGPFHEPYVERLAAWLGRHVRAGDLGAPVELAAFVLFGLCHGLIRRWLASGRKRPLAGEAARAVRLFLDGAGAGDDR